MPYDLEEISIKTGISVEKLRKELQVMNAMQDLFLELSNKGQEVALYGGTALNKIYYGPRQRLSYDIDIDSPTYGKAKKAITLLASKTIVMKKACRAEYEGVVIDLTEATGLEKPVLLKARSMLEFFGYPANSVTVPSYSLEYILARKTMAMLSRMVNKDIYDMWIGLQLLKDKAKYRRYVESLAAMEELDLDYLLASFEYSIKLGWNTEREKVDVTENVDILMAAGDVALGLKRIGIGEVKKSSDRVRG